MKSVIMSEAFLLTSVYEKRYIGCFSATDWAKLNLPSSELDESIASFRVCVWYFLILFKF